MGVTRFEMEGRALQREMVQQMVQLNVGLAKVAERLPVREVGPWAKWFVVTADPTVAYLELFGPFLNRWEAKRHEELQRTMHDDVCPHTKDECKWDAASVEVQDPRGEADDE